MTDLALPTETQWLNRAQAADYICRRGFQVRASSLAKYAVVGSGPVFRRWNRRCIYSPADLEAWIATRLSPPMKSTAEAA